MVGKICECTDPVEDARGARTRACRVRTLANTNCDREKAFTRVCVKTGAWYTHRTGRIVYTFRNFSRRNGPSVRWESGNPAFGFPLFHRTQFFSRSCLAKTRAQTVGAVGMWESRRFREISKTLWERWKSCCWISTVSTPSAFLPASRPLLRSACAVHLALFLSSSKVSTMRPVRSV